MPSARARRATSAPELKQWIRPVKPPLAYSSSRMSPVSRSASRVCTISGRPVWRAAAMWRAEALGLLLARAVLVVEVEAGLADADDLGMARRLDQAVAACVAPPPSPRADERRPSTRYCRGVRRWRAPCRIGRAACRWSACRPRRPLRARASTPASSPASSGKSRWQWLSISISWQPSPGSTKRGNTPCGLGSAVPGTSSRSKAANARCPAGTAS